MTTSINFDGQTTALTKEIDHEPIERELKREPMARRIPDIVKCQLGCSSAVTESLGKAPWHCHHCRTNNGRNVYIFVLLREPLSSMISPPVSE